MSEKVTPSVMEDPEDLELKKLMGAHFQDQTQEPAPAHKGEQKLKTVKGSLRKKTCKKVMDDAWVPVKAEPTEIQRLVNCAKGTVVYGGLSTVLFWWQQAGLLAPEAAWPSFIIVALLAGINIGRYMPRG